MKPIVLEMYRFLVRMQQSPFTRETERKEVEELLERATKELFEPELAAEEGEPKKLICHLMDLNIKADEPTANGRTYSRDVLEKAIKKWEGDREAHKARGTMMVFPSLADHPPPLQKMLGQVERMHLSDDGELFGSGFLVQTPNSGDLEFIKELLDHDKLQFSMAGKGTVDDVGNVEDVEFTCVVLGPKPPGNPIDMVAPEPPEPPEAPPCEKIRE